MTFKTFEELDVQGGPPDIYANDAQQSQRPDGEGMIPIPVPQTGDAISAAFRQNNTVASMISRKDSGMDNHDDGSFNYAQYVKDNSLDGYEDTFAGILNTRYADAVRDQIKMEQADKQTLAASGWVGTVAGIAAGIVDLPTLIPGTVAVRGAKGGFSVAKSILMGGASAMATQVGTEAALQASQRTRTADESLFNIGTAAVMGSLMGGAAAGILGKNERISASRALDSMSDINSGKVANTLVEPKGASLGAAVAPSEFEVPIEDAARSRADLDVAGTVADKTVKLTSWFNPMLRGTQRLSSAARQTSATLYESTIYRAMHGAGDTTGVSVEAASRMQVQAMTSEAYSQAEGAYKEMAKAGTGMSKDNFYNEVGEAMRNNDEHANPAVVRAAQSYRKLFDHFTKQALDLGLLGEKDLDVKTAASYFSRVYDRDKLIGTEDTFLDVIGKHFTDRMQEAHAEDAATLQATRGQHKQLLDDLQQTGAARAKRVDEVWASGKALDAQHADLNDTIDQLVEGRQKIRAGDETGRGMVKQATEQGGERLQKYLAEQQQIRRRMRNLTEHNPDAMLATGDKVRERIDNMHENTERSIASTLRSGKNLLNSIGRDPVGQMEEKIAIFKDRADVALNKVARTEAHLGKLTALNVNDEALAKTAALLEKQKRKLTELVDLLDRHKEAGPAFAKAREQKLTEALTALTEGQAARDLRRGEQLAKMKARAKKLSPEEVKARVEGRMAKHNNAIGSAEDKFAERWQKRLAMDVEQNSDFDFQASGRQTAQEIFDKITGRTAQQEDMPAFITKITSGPLKDRTFMVPDNVMSPQGWLKSDARVVGQRYARVMAGEIELTRRYGNATMKNELEKVAGDYQNLRTQLFNAKSIDEVNQLLGTKYAAKRDLEAAKTHAKMQLDSDQKGALEDLKAGRDMIRGNYKTQENMTNFASVTRSLAGFNYLRQMGGVLLANLTDFYRPAMVHGLGLYISHLPGHMAQMFGKGSEGLKLSLGETRKSGLVIERLTHSMMQSNGDVLDPFIGRTTQIERFMHKGTQVASRWNLINVFTDMQQAISSTMSQHRIMEAVLGNKGDGTFLHTDGERLIRMLGIDANTQKDIAALYGAHGREIDGIKVPMTEDWLRDASALDPRAGTTNAARAEKAVRTYRAALNTDVNSIVARRGLGDAPLFVHHPLGKLLTQFSGYAMGAHSRVMVRGMQESKARFIGGLAALTTMGAMVSYLAAWRSGRERFDKYVAETSANPALLIGEGLDRSGFFPMLFDFSNRTERLSGAVGYNYRVNPIKSAIALAGGGRGAVGMTSTRASDSSGAFGAVFGPTAGLIDSGVAAARVGADKATGQKVTKHDANTALAGVPLQSYYGVREIIQMMLGNSPYFGN